MASQRFASNPSRSAALAFAGVLLPAFLALLEGCGNGKVPAESVARPVIAPQPVPTAIPARRTITAVELPDYVGSRRCVSCHRAQSAQLTSHHATTLTSLHDERVRAPFAAAAAVPDPHRRAQYQPLRAGSTCAIRTVQGDRRMDVKPDYAFGSGNRCWTYVVWNAGKPFETRISYYRQIGKWDYTPGQQGKRGAGSPLGRALDSAETEECFLCHSTAVVKEYDQLQPERSIFGVSCESCHGPGREHLAAVAQKSPDLRMIRFSEHRAQLSQRLCGKCHRDRDSGDPHDPGTAAQLPRLQGLAMAQSACFKKSGGKLGCVTCHDPHRNASETTRAAYNATCSSCHQLHATGQVACSKAPLGDCVSCHMPSQAVNMPTRPRFRTHWIKVWD